MFGLFIIETSDIVGLNYSVLFVKRMHYLTLLHLLNTSKHPAVNFPKTEALALSKVQS